MVTALLFFLLMRLFQFSYSNDPLGLTNTFPEENMNATEVINYDGYPAKEYEVTTEDGYILTVIRIPHGKNNTDISVERKPILLQHGLLASCTCWIFDPPYKTLAYLLAERGYDVWLGNYRGNTYGRRHTTLSPEELEFWLFSFDQMALYDLPGMIDLILMETGFSQLDLVGHSMGTTGPLIMLSTKTEYNKKVRSFHAFAPVGKLEYCKSPFLQLIAPLSDQLFPVQELLGGYEVLPRSPIYKVLADTACKVEVTNELCSTAIFLFFGLDYEQFNQTRLPVYMHFFPAGASAQTLQHYGQIIKYNRFQWFDYGLPELNQEKYNQSTPPLYDLSKISTRVALYYGVNDWLAQPEDVAYIAENIPKEYLILDYTVPFAEWNHGDFLWARDVIPLLYDKFFATL